MAAKVVVYTNWFKMFFYINMANSKNIYLGLYTQVYKWRLFIKL